MAPSSGYPSGIAPWHIKEPEIRKEYEERIKKNNERALFQGKMYNLISFQKSLKAFQEGTLRRCSIDELNHTALPMVKIFLTKESRKQEWENYIKELIRKKTN